MFKGQQTDIRSNPDYYYMVGQLVGCTIMLSTHAQLYGDEKSKGMAKRADDILKFFLPKDDLGGWQP